MSGLWRLRIGISDRDIFPYGERGAGRERKISRHIAGSRSSANSLWQGGWRRAHSVRDCLPKWDFFSPTLAGRYRYTRSVAHWLPKWICGSVRDFVAQSFKWFAEREAPRDCPYNPLIIKYLHNYKLCSYGLCMAKRVLKTAIRCLIFDRWMSTAQWQ